MVPNSIKLLGRRLERLTENRNRNTKRTAENQEPEFVDGRGDKKRKVDQESETLQTRVIKKRQCADTERHRAQVKLRKERERKDRESVGIKGETRVESREY